MNKIEQKIRENILASVIKYFSKAIVVNDENILIKKIGIRFIFSEAFSANLILFYNIPLGTFYGFKVQKFLHYAEGPEIKCKSFEEVNDILRKCCSDVKEDK